MSRPLVLLVALAAAAAAAPSALEQPSSRRQPLPDTSAITGELTEKHGVAKFFSLWLVFNDPAEIDVKTGVDYVILAPKEPAPLQTETDPQDRPAVVKKLLLDHVILGQKLNLAARDDKKAFAATTLGGREVQFSYKDGHWWANNAKIVEAPAEIPPNGELVVLDNYAFDASSPPVATEAARTEEAATTTTAAPEPPSPAPLAASTTPEPFSGDLVEELSKIPQVFNLKRVPIFNEFLANANVSALLKPGEQYTVLFPMDRAFQNWHPIDWGFYPFSVPEFTSEIIRSHFIRGQIKLDEITDTFEATTLTNRTVTFKKSPTSSMVTANRAQVIGKGVALQKGTVLVVSEVLFVDHQVVHELRMHNRDKETPPLIAFPWWNAQFLSHAYLSLESNGSFPSTEKLLSVAVHLHHIVPGRDYTFLVPTEDAYKKAGLQVPTWWSESQAAKLLQQYPNEVEHFLQKYLVKSRYYMRDLTEGRQIETLEKKNYTIVHKGSEVWVKNGDLEARIVEGDHFVYNLGTLLFVDSLLAEPSANLREMTQQERPTESPREAEETTPMVLVAPGGDENLFEETAVLVFENENTETASEAAATTPAEAKSESSEESNAIPALPAEP